MIQNTPGRITSVFFCLIAAFVMISGCGSPAGKTEKVESGAVTGTVDLLPADGQGWARSGDPRTFNAENLWEYIDGGAEGYLIYNFQDVATQDYEDANAGLQATLDIYHMSDDMCGFGIYSSERPYEADYMEIGGQGYFTGNALHFWQGPYYVKITSFKEGDEVKDRLVVLAREVTGKLGTKAVVPAELDVFPKENLIPNTVRYLARDVLGQSDLKNGFTAEYKEGDTEFKLFFILHDTVEDARKSLESYKQFMSKYGEGVEDHTGEEVTWFAAKDLYYGHVVAMQAGKTMLGVLGLEDAEKVNQYISEMQEKLSALGHI